MTRGNRGAKGEKHRSRGELTENWSGWERGGVNVELEGGMGKYGKVEMERIKVCKYFLDMHMHLNANLLHSKVATVVRAERENRIDEVHSIHSNHIIRIENTTSSCQVTAQVHTIGGIRQEEDNICVTLVNDRNKQTNKQTTRSNDEYDNTYVKHITLL